MEKRRPSLPAAAIAANLGLYIHLGGWRPTELERLKNGAGRWMRRIDAAMEDWRDDLAAIGASVVPVVLLYRCRGLDRISSTGFDASEPIGPKASMGLRIAPPIVIELGEVASAQIEKLLRGSGKALEETREAMRLVQLKAADEGAGKIFVPIVATCVAPQHSLSKDHTRGEDGASGVAARRLTIRYFRASHAKVEGNRKGITIV
jgi:hypothetical protein